jgi:hypothetical protein
VSWSREELEAEGFLDFRRFLKEVWAYLKIPDGKGGYAKVTPVQNDIAYNLQHGERRLIIEAFRGVGKSWITVSFVLWTLLLNPQAKIMVVSASEQHAINFTTFCRKLIDGIPILQHLRPKASQRDSVLAFDVGPATEDLSPSVKSVGITGQLTGSRADVIVADDVETPKNSYTHVLREKIADLVKEFDAVLKPGGRVIYLGTPQIESSLYNRLYKERGYTVRIWPAEVPEDPSKYHGKLAPFIYRLVERGVPAHTPVEPSRFPEQELAERRLSYRADGYALQFMLDTSPSDADKFPLKLSDLMVMDVDAEMAPVKLVWGRDKDQMLTDLAAGGLEGDVYYKPMWKSPEMAKFTGTVMAIDPSAKGKDETGYSIVRSLHGLLFWVDCGGFVDGFGEATLKALAAKAIRHRVNTVLIEENYGGGMFNQLLLPWLQKLATAGNVPCPRVNPEDYDGWSRGQKELRILDTLTPVFKAHRLIVDRSVIEEDLKVQHDRPEYSVVQQMTRMSRLKGALSHEDRLESLAQACGYFTERMNRDQERMLTKHKQDLMDEEIRRFLEDTDQGPSYSGYRYAHRRV